MSDENNSVVEQPELSDAPVANEPAETNEPADNGDEGGQEQAEELEEVELDGEKLSVPKRLKLKDKILLQADYTRKTQELADQRKTLEKQLGETISQERARLEHERSLVTQQEDFAAARAQLRAYDAYTPEQWQQAAAENPAGAQQEWMRYQALKDKAQRLHHELSQAEQRRAFEAQQSAAKRIEQAEADIRAEIKDWSPTRQKELREFAKSLGASDDDLQGVSAAWMVKALHKAALYDRYAKQATKPAPPPQATPVRTIAGQAKGSVNPDKLSIDEWMKREDARERERRRRA